MIIRELYDEDLVEAVKLKGICLPEELGEFCEKDFDLNSELKFWFDWMHTGVEHNDVRVLLGAFEKNVLCGSAFASFAEKEDSGNGFELNGLWVHPSYRRKGISLRLLIKLLNYYQILGLSEIVIYCYHNAPSNIFYQKLGAKVFRQDLQTKKRIQVDVFLADIAVMKKRIKDIGIKPVI